MFSGAFFTAIALLAIVLGNLITSYISTDNISAFRLLVGIRFFTGLVGTGTAFALGIAAVGNTSEPDKNFGYTIASQIAMGSLIAFFVPNLIEKYAKFAKILLNETNCNHSKIFYVGDNPKKDTFLSNYDVKTFII